MPRHISPSIRVGAVEDTATDTRGSELERHLDGFERSAFRLETLDSYDVGREHEDFRRYLAGAPLPLNRNDDWCKRVAADVQAGKTYERIHVMPETLTPYLRYEIEWGYVLSALAGELITVVPASDPLVARALVMRDFWLFDDEVVLQMHYDPANRFVGATRLADEGQIAEHRRIRNDLRTSATPLTAILASLRSG